MRVRQTNLFERAVKKLHTNEKEDLDKAVRAVMGNPRLGELKRGDLAGVRVYKFPMQNRQALLGYLFENESAVLTLVSIGSHENFYRDMKRHLKG